MQEIVNKEHEQLIRHLKGVRRVVINNCHGGFSLSHRAVQAYLDKLGLVHWVEKDDKFKSLDMSTYWLVPPEERVNGSPDNWNDMTLAERQAHNAAYSKQTFHDRDLDRDDPYLVSVVEELGNEANGKYSELKIVEIPADVDWYIEEYDGSEWVAEKHRTWR